MLATGSSAMTHQGVKYPIFGKHRHLPGKQDSFLRPKRSSFHTSLGYMISWYYHPLSHTVECAYLRFTLASVNPTMGRENACLTFLTPSKFHVSIVYESHVVV